MLDIQDTSDSLSSPIDSPSVPVARQPGLHTSFAKVVQYLQGRPFVSGVMALAGGAAIANLVSIAVTPLCTRIYTPQDFGIFAQFAAITSILLPAASLGFEIALPLEKDSERAISAARLCLLLLGVMATVTAALFFFGPGIVPKWVDRSMTRYWWIAVITVAASGYYQMATFFAMRNRSYVAIGKTTFQQALAGAAVQVLGGLVVKGPSPLLISTAVGSGLGGHRLIRRCGAGLALWRDKWRLAQLLSVARQYWSLASGALSSNTLNMFANQLPMLLVSATYGLKVCGLFLLAARVVSVTDRVITGSVAQTYYGEASLRFSEDPRSLRPLFLKAVFSLTLIGLAGALAIWVLAPLVTRLVFGPAWAEAGIYARYMAPRFLGTMIFSPVSDTTFIIGRRLSKTALECIRLGSTAVLFWFCEATHQTPAFAVFGYSLMHLCIGLGWTTMLIVWINAFAHLPKPNSLPPSHETF